MRVTASVGLRTTLNDLTSSLQRLQDSQRRLASGKAHERMSDDPRSASDVMFLRGAIGRHDQMSRTADQTRSRLAMADTTLVSVSDSLIRVKSLAVQASNTGASAGSNASIAGEVRLLRNELLATANAEHLGRSLFGGTADGAAYDPTDGSFIGNTTVESRTVSDQVRLPANVTGQQVFGDQSAPEGDLFAVLDRLATAIESGDATAIATEHANLDSATDRVHSAVAEVGRRITQLDGLEAHAAARREQLVARLSDIEDVDLAEAVIDMKARETAHQAALAAAAKGMPQSLADFLL